MKANEHYFITVFTPTFNRAHTLPRVYDSLCQQTFQDFEWLIIDDGSTDQTAKLVATWINEEKITIHYHHQPNSGKHFAHNHALKKAQGKFFCVLDSDDTILDNALKIMVTHWQGIPKADQPRFSGVCGLCVNEQGQIVGKKFPQDILESNVLEMKFKYKITSEKWAMHKTEALRKFPFPEIKIRYLPESYVWNQLARQYSFLYINQPLRVYYQTDESIMNVQDYKKMAPSAILQHQLILNQQLDFFFDNPFEFIKSSIHYTRFSFHHGTGLLHQINQLTTLNAKFLWLFTLPLSCCVYIKDQLKKT